MSKRRSAVIAVLAFGLLGALLVIGLISRGVRSSEEYVHALAFWTHAPAVVADLTSLTEVHEKHGWQIVRASWTYEGATKDLGTEPSP